MSPSSREGEGRAQARPSLSPVGELRTSDMRFLRGGWPAALVTAAALFLSLGGCGGSGHESVTGQDSASSSVEGQADNSPRANDGVEHKSFQGATPLSERSPDHLARRAHKRRENEKGRQKVDGSDGHTQSRQPAKIKPQLQEGKPTEAAKTGQAGAVSAPATSPSQSTEGELAKNAPTPAEPEAGGQSEATLAGQ